MTTTQPCCPTGPAAGYFGKPTKARSEEPTMYEILTWHPEAPVSNGKQSPKQTCTNCQKCSCSSPDSAGEKEAYNPQKYQRKSLKNSLQTEDLKNRRDSKILQNGNNPLSKNQSLHQNSQSQAKVNSQQIQKLKPKQRPESATHYGQKTNSRKSTPNYMKSKGAPLIQSEEDKENKHQQNEKKIQKFVQTTRWISNSAFTTYFGKPAFQNYGRGNTNPCSGGLLYGNYLKSHNVQPHRGQNSPAHMQSYNVALMKAKQIGEVCPYPPKMNRKDMEAALKETAEQAAMERSPISAEKCQMRSLPIKAPPLADLEKFGGKGIPKLSRTRYSVPYDSSKNSPDHCQW